MGRLAPFLGGDAGANTRKCNLGESGAIAGPFCGREGLTGRGRRGGQSPTNLTHKKGVGGLNNQCFSNRWSGSKTGGGNRAGLEKRHHGSPAAGNRCFSKAYTRAHASHVGVCLANGHFSTLRRAESAQLFTEGAFCSEFWPASVEIQGFLDIRKASRTSVV